MPGEFECRARVVGGPGRHGDAVLPPGAHGKHRLRFRRLRDEAQRIDPLSGERHDDACGRIEPDSAVGGGGPAVPRGRRQLPERLAGLQRRAPVAALDASVRACDRRAEREVVVRGPLRRRPPERHGHRPPESGGASRAVADADAVDGARLRDEAPALRRLRFDRFQRGDGIAPVDVDMHRLAVGRAADAEAELAVGRRGPCVPSRRGRPPAGRLRVPHLVARRVAPRRVARGRRAPRDLGLTGLGGGGQQVDVDRSVRAVDGARGGERVVRRRSRRRRRRTRGPHRDREHRRIGVPRRRGEIQLHGALAAVADDESQLLGLAGADLAERQVGAEIPVGRDVRNAVFARALDGRQAHAAAVRRSERAALDAQPRAGGHVAVDRQLQRQLVTPAPEALAVGAQAKVRRGRAAYHGPRQGGAGRGRVDAPRQHLGPVDAGRRVSDHDPLHVVAAGRRGMLAARGSSAVAVAVEPQVEVVQHLGGDDIGRRLVPRQHQVEAARAIGDDDVPVRVLAALQFGYRAAVGPAVRAVPVQHRGPGRRLAEPVPGVQGARTLRIVRRKPFRRVQPRIGPDGARHQARPSQRRLLPVRRHGVHQQGRDAGDRGRRRARPGRRLVVPAAAAAPGRADVHARRHDLRRQPPVGGRPVAAEHRQVAAVTHRAHGQGVFRRARVGEGVRARVALYDGVELAVVPDHGIEFAHVRGPPREVAAGRGEAHVDDERPHKLARAGGISAPRRAGEKVHAAHDAVGAAGTGVTREHLGEPDVSDRRRHARKPRLHVSVAENGARHMRPVAVAVDPQVVVGAPPVRGHEVRPADARAVRRNVQVADVEARVHDADGNGRAAAGEQPRRAPGAQRVGPHGGDGRIVRRLDGAHGFDGQHEVGLRDGFEGARLDDGRIGADVGVERPDHSAHPRERVAPAAVGVARHQRDEHRDPLRRRARRPGKELGIRRHGAQAADRGERRDALKARAVPRQPGADQASRGAERFRVERRQPLGQILWRRPRGEPDPAEGPVAPRAFGCAHKPIERIGRIEPLRSRSVFGSRAELLVERRPGHLSVMPDDSVTRRRNRRHAVPFRPRRHESGRRGRGHHRRSGRPRAAFRVDAGRRRGDRAGLNGTRRRRPRPLRPVPARRHGRRAKRRERRSRQHQRQYPQPCSHSLNAPLSISCGGHAATVAWGPGAACSACLSACPRVCVRSIPLRQGTAACSRSGPGERCGATVPCLVRGVSQYSRGRRFASTPSVHCAGAAVSAAGQHRAPRTSDYAENLFVDPADQPGQVPIVVERAVQVIWPDRGTLYAPVALVDPCDLGEPLADHVRPMPRHVEDHQGV